MPPPFTHYLGDDFSPPNSGMEKYEPFLGPIYRDGEQVGERRMYHCKSLGGKSANNMGRSLRHMFIIIRRGLHNSKGTKGLLTLFCNVIIQPETMAGLEQAAKVHGKRTGIVAPLVAHHTPKEMDKIFGFGGCRDRGFAGLKKGMKIGSWDPKWPNGTPRIDVLPWCHLSAAWFPRATILRHEIDPDAERFGLYFADQDICLQVQRNCDLDVIVTSNAAVSRDYNAKATKYFFPGVKAKIKAHSAAYDVLKRKWGI